jgi:hypothetical protein
MSLPWVDTAKYFIDVRITYEDFVVHFDYTVKVS